MAKFKRYDSYKNSGVEWLGQIPSHWEMKKHKYCFVLNKEIVGNNSSNLQLLSLTKNGIKAIDKFDQSGKAPISFDTYQFISKDDIVMCLFDLDVSAVFSGISPYEGMISSAYKSFKCNSNLLPKYCDYFFRNVFVSRKYKIYSKNVRFTMNVDDFMSLYIPPPPKDEQEKIASYLDEKIAKIDTAISGKEKLIELLKEQKQIIINDAVTKGLNKNAKFKNSGVEWLGEIPSHWEVVRLGSLGIFSKGNGISRNELVADGIPAILYGDIYTKYNYQAIEIKNFISTETSLKAVKISENDILLTGSGETKDDIGKCVVFKGKKAFAGGDIIIFKQDKNNSTFLAYSLNSSYSIMQKTIMAKGEIIVHIYSSMLKELLLPLPPKDEQEKIVEYIENKISKIDKLLNLEQECIKSLKEYKASLIDSVVTGKVRV